MSFYTHISSLILCLWLGQTGLYAQDIRRMGVDYLHTYPHYAPVLSPDGSLLLYSETGNHANYGRENLADIWICQYLGDNQWSRPVNAGMPINSDQADQCLAINLDENEMFLLLEDEEGKKTIAQSSLNFRTWSAPQIMRIEPWDSLFQIHHGFVSNDGQTLLLCIFHPDSTQQQIDIYVAQREGPLSWKNLQSLGPGINTNGRESSVFLAADGQTLYFSSNGHPGFGGQDLFMSRRAANSWSEWSPPINLGESFNTSNDDWGFTTSVLGAKAWWSTLENKIPVIRSTNIPATLRPQSVILIKGQVYLPQSKAPAANVSVNLNYFDPVNNRRVSRVAISNQQGKYQLLLPRNAAMSINALSEQFFSPTYNLLRKGALEIEAEDKGSEQMALLTANPTYRQVEGEIEALQLAFNQKTLEIKVLEKERVKFVDAIIQLRDDTIPGNISIKTAELGLKKLKDDYEASQKQQLLLFHDDPIRPPTSTSSAQRESPTQAIPTDFDDFLRLIVIQQRWEILPTTTQSLILQMLGEEIKRQDKEIAPENRSLWRGEKERILNNPSILLLPEAALAKWQGVFSPCFEWQEVFSRDISNLYLQKNQAELTTLIKNEVRNYLRALLDYRLLVAQSLHIKNEISTKVEGQRRIERNFQNRPVNSVEIEPSYTLDTLMVIAGNELEQDIQLFDPIVEKTIILENIIFLSNQAELDSSAYSEIHRLASFLNANPQLGIEIVAHTNNNCTYNFAADLTAQRAEKIAELLIDAQIAAERIRHRGTGKEQPLVSNTTLAGRLANQRVEITFIPLL